MSTGQYTLVKPTRDVAHITEDQLRTQALQPPSAAATTQVCTNPGSLTGSWSAIQNTRRWLRMSVAAMLVATGIVLVYLLW